MDSAHADHRYEHVENTRYYQTLTGTLMWLCVCGIALMTYLQATGWSWLPDRWSGVLLGTTGVMALAVPYQAWKAHPHAWPVLNAISALAVMFLMLLSYVRTIP